MTSDIPEIETTTTPITKNYQIIWSEEQVEKFADLFFTDYIDDQVAVIQLMSRRKYDPENSESLGHHTVLKRHILHPDNKLLQKLRQLEVPYGTFVGKNGEKPITQQSLVVYTSLNPKSMLQGWIRTNNELMDAIVRDIYTTKSGLSTENARLVHKLESKLASSICKNISEKRYLDIDVDSKEYPYLDYVLHTIRKEIGIPEKAIIETRGGYHVIVDKRMMDKNASRKLWEAIQCKEFDYQGSKYPTTFMATNFSGESVKQTWISMIADTQVPTPGTIQGGFQVKLV